MKKNLLILAMGFTASALLFTGCKEDPKAVEPAAPYVSDGTIYGDLGGNQMMADPKNGGAMIETGRYTLRAVVDSTIFVIAADQELSPFFEVLLAELGAGKTTGLSNLSENLTDFFCVATGSKNTAYAYSGLNMIDAHDPAKNSRMAKFATNNDMTKFINDVVAGAGKNGVPANAPIIARIGALLETLRNDVVQATTIYEDLGGNTLMADPKNSGQMIETGRFTLRAVVDSTIFVIAADNRLNGYFEILLNEVGGGNTTGFATLSENLVDFFCVATGSKNSAYAYTGLNMTAAHNRATNPRMGKVASNPNFDKADNAAFDAFIDDVVKGAGKNGVPATAPVIGRVGALLETLRTTVVQR